MSFQPPLLADVLNEQPSSGNVSSSTNHSIDDAEQPSIVGSKSSSPAEISNTEGWHSQAATTTYLSSDVPPPLEVEHVPSNYEPSLLLKAYAFALLPFISLWPELSINGQAFFVASPLQRGIPTGSEVYANGQLYQHANSMQTDATPIFQSNHGDFFEWLNKYVNSVRDESLQDPTKTAEYEQRYQQYKREADQEYQKCIEDYQKVTETDKSLNFQAYMSKYGKTYIQACDLRDQALSLLTGSDVRRAKQTFDSAQARLEHHLGNNMKCSLQDFDVGNNMPLDGGHNNFIYRPLYFLSGYDSAATSWINKNFQGAPPVELMLDLRGSASRSWRELGFPQFDKEPPSDILGNIPVGLRAVIKCAGIGFFEVGRGLWNIESFRYVLPKLMLDADKILTNKVYKTRRLLLAYNVELLISLTKASAEEMAVSNSKLDIFADLLSGMPFTPDVNGDLRAGIHSSSGYPVLLGALAEKC